MSDVPVLVVNKVRAITATVARHYGLTPTEVVSGGRSTPLSEARQVAWHLVRLHTRTRSNSAIGRAFSRDPTTVDVGLRRIAARIEAEPALRARVNAIASELSWRQP